MGLLFEEIDCQPSRLGDISLRRRRIPALGDRDIYEVKLGDEFLMSSLFVEAEKELSNLGLAALDGDQWKVVVGGLGLGYTAVEALRNDRVGELLVVEALDTVIHWHQQEKVPLGAALNRDERCRYVHGSFFDLAVSEAGFDPDHPGSQLDAILLDIDHSPRALLNDSNASFYTHDSLQKMASHLRTGGIFGLWSNEPPDEEFMGILRALFTDVEAQEIAFYNPFQNREAYNTVYLARKAAGSAH